MSLAYNIVLSAARTALIAATAVAPDESRAKTVRFGRGQIGCLDALSKAAARIDRSRPVVWIHSASLGEFAIARPLIRELKERMDCGIVVTFFSPTGYEALQRRPMEEVDAVLYLPLDTAANASRFLDEIRPACAVFMVSEFWHNYLAELAAREIPTFLVSAIIRDDSPFFKWYGAIYRKSILTYRHIFALDSHSVDNLGRLGQTRCSLNGDPLFDNATLMAETQWSDPLIETFKAGKPLFVAGSIHDDEDLDMVCALANRNEDTKFVIVPHEISDEIISKLRTRLDGRAVLYSEASQYSGKDLEEAQVLIIDFVGALAYIYRYATWAYVGGGFTPLLHSVVEPVVYGVPVAFGPCIHRKVTPRELIELGIGCMVTTADELESWFGHLRSDRSALDYIAKKAKKYVSRNVGATTRVADAIISSLSNA